MGVKRGWRGRDGALWDVLMIVTRGAAVVIQRAVVLFEPEVPGFHLYKSQAQVSPSRSLTPRF